MKYRLTQKTVDISDLPKEPPVEILIKGPYVQVLKVTPKANSSVDILLLEDERLVEDLKKWQAEAETPAEKEKATRSIEGTGAVVMILSEDDTTFLESYSKNLTLVGESNWGNKTLYWLSPGSGSFENIFSSCFF